VAKRQLLAGGADRLPRRPVQRWAGLLAMTSGIEYLGWGKPHPTLHGVLFVSFRGYIFPYYNPSASCFLCAFFQKVNCNLFIFNML